MLEMCEESSYIWVAVPLLTRTGSVHQDRQRPTPAPSRVYRRLPAAPTPAMAAPHRALCAQRNPPRATPTTTTRVPAPDPRRALGPERLGGWFPIVSATQRQRTPLEQALFR